LCDGVPVVIQPQISVNSSDAIETALEFPIRVNRSNGGLTTEVAIHAADCEVGSFACFRARWWHREPGGCIVCDQQTQGPRPILAGQTRSQLRVDDSPCKNQVERTKEVVCVFKEEGPLFRKGHFEPLTDGDLWVVRLYLTEIGVDRYV